MLKSTALPKIFDSVVVLFAVLTFSIGSASAQGLSATIHITPEHVLPGLPVGFDVLLVNASTSDASILTTVGLRVVPPTGEPFDTQDRDALNVEPFAADVVLAANSTRSFLIAASPLTGAPAFFNDSRLTTPGHYALRLVLHRKVPGSEDGALDPVLSNEVTLTVEQPHGEDLTVWQRMQQVVAPKAWNAGEWQYARDLVSEICRNHPHSRYVQDVVSLLAVRDAEWLDIADEAIAIDPSSVQAEFIRLGMAGVHWNMYQEALGAWDIETALLENAESIRIKKEVARTTHSPYVLALANRGLELAQTDAEVRAIFDAKLASLRPATDPVIPGVDCIEKGIDRGGFVVRFNYSLAGTGAKFLRPGPGNRITPGVPDQGQARFFQHGRHSFAASGVSATGENVSWQVDGRTATATADFPTVCPPGTALPVRPVVECVKNDNEGAVVSFGYDNPNRFAVALPIGERNRFSDTPDDGQPAVFLPGRQRAVFKVKVKDAPVTWTLDSKSVTANPREPRVCSTR